MRSRLGWRLLGDEPAQRRVRRLRGARDAAVVALIQLDRAEHVIRIGGVAHDAVEADVHRPARMPDLDEVRADERLQPHAHDARIVLPRRAVAKRHGAEHVPRQRRVRLVQADTRYAASARSGE